MDTQKRRQFFDRLAPSWDENETCPVERKRALLARLPLQAGDRVLDLACGTGVVTGLVHEITSAPVVGVDISPKMIEIARQKYKDEPWASFVEGDLFNVPLARCDFALIYNAYPHFADPKGLSARLEALLDKGGRFAILHSLSRKQLDAHHAHCMDLSRSLEEPQAEARHFAKEFVIDLAQEGDDFYLIAGHKR